MRFVAVIVFSVVSDLLAAWFVMLFLAAANREDARIPNLGYWSTFWLVAAGTCIVGAALSVREFREATE